MGMVNLHDSWKGPLQAEFDAPYMAALKEFLVAERARGKRIFPKGSEWFHALDVTPLEQVRVVILGQDPYHGEGPGPWALLFGEAGGAAAAFAHQHLQGNEK